MVFVDQLTPGMFFVAKGVLRLLVSKGEVNGQGYCYIYWLADNQLLKTYLYRRDTLWIDHVF